jgi:peroxiredoxin
VAAADDDTPTPPEGATADAGDGDVPDDDTPTPPDGASADAGDGDGGEPSDDGAESPTRRRSPLDARTLAICVLIAFIAAAVTYLAVSALTGDDDDEPVADPAAETLELTAAEQIPEVTLERFDGSEVSTTDYAGTPLVVNFWASWCVPCTTEMPEFQEVHESLGEDVAFLGVNVRDQVETAEAMVERTGVTYDIARDTSGDLARELGVSNLPVTVLVAPDGTVLDTLYQQVSGERLCEAITASFGDGDCG